MCGISGVYAVHLTDQHHQMIDAIIESQLPRGPDYQAKEVIHGKQSEILLGHNRLSIIDLSEQANQPMWDVTGRYCIVYNGEIYNYLELRDELKKAGLRFHTQSDTEVILNAFAYWGIHALQYFCGPFAFALFDREKEITWLCRDRFGVRPLYYVQQNQTIYFASTTSVLANSFHLKPNHAYIAKGLQYLIYEDDSALTPYDGMLAVPAGSYLIAQFDQKKILTSFVHRYYDLTEQVQHTIETLPLNKDDVSTLIDQQFKKAVDIRLRTDVPLAISLSGGLDSSSVAALVSERHEHTIGFSFGHPDVKHSEGPIVAHCAKYLNIEMEYVWPTADEIIEGLYKTVSIQDAPFSTLSMVAQYLLYQRVRHAGIKVLLGGQGGDEAFMGYKKFLFFWMKQLIDEKKYFSSAKQAWQCLPGFFSNMASFKTYWQHRHRYLQKQQKNLSPSSVLTLSDTIQLQLNQGSQRLWQRQLQDITQFSLPTLLRYEDRNSMSHSVESRLPFMDHRLIEIGLALPTHLKLRAGYGKWIIRKIMQNKIPDNIRLARYKRGFDISLSELLKKGLGESIRATLKENRSILSDFLSTSINIHQHFSDQQFLQRPATMSEAISLLWLNKVLT